MQQMVRRFLIASLNTAAVGALLFLYAVSAAAQSTITTTMSHVPVYNGASCGWAWTGGATGGAGQGSFSIPCANIVLVSTTITKVERIDVPRPVPGPVRIERVEVPAPVKEKPIRE